jgi:hypothetical protein
MNRSEQASYISRQAQQRDELSRQLAEKIRQRDAFVRETSKKKPDGAAPGDSFDRAVARTLKKQIK